MTVQDDKRERELVRMFNLGWDPAHQRAGVDALLDVRVDGTDYLFEVEVKSTTGDTVSTARDVGVDHIAKWRTKIFVVGFYTREKSPELIRCLCLTPLDMEPWIGSIESKIAIDFKIAQRAARLLQLDDLHDVCGEQEWYTRQDAERIHKQQWTSEEYDAALDLTLENGQRVLSAGAMLEILRLRSRYIAERGATLNNPHVPKKHLAPFFGTDREIPHAKSAEGIRLLAREFARANPTHAAVLAAKAAAGDSTLPF